MSYNKPSSSRGGQRRGHGRGRFNNHSDDSERRPEGLKGKEIGLYYRNKYMEKNKHKRERNDMKTLGTIWLSEEKKKDIQKIIDSCNDSVINMSKATDNTYDHIEDSDFKKHFLSIVNGDITTKLGQKSFTLTRDSRIDNALLMHSKAKLKDEKYFNMLKQRSKLPAMDLSTEIVDLVEKNQVVVISGETGCGKTTQVAQFILDHYIENEKGSICKIVCTQPRRISAISVAERVADERAEKLGLSVGYQIRLESKFPRDVGSITFCTTGILLKQMERDPSLSKISHIILDEIHERDIMSDFLITILKQLISVREDVKVILMSATLNSDAFSKYYNNAPCITIPGFTYPVEEYFLEDVIARTGFEFPQDRRPTWLKRKNRKNEEKVIDEFNNVILPYVRDIESRKEYSSFVCNQLRNPESEKLSLDLIFALLVNICQKEKEEGAILIFVTGFAEISSLNKNIEQSRLFPKHKFNIIPLHSQMPTVDQKQIFQPSPPGVRKIIISTNIAETSITIDDVVFVIDCGKIKISNYNIETNTETLTSENISLANASQRRGRAGRVKPGVCFHLYSRARHMVLDKFLTPEILRSRLESVVLRAKILQLGKVEPFFEKLLDAPIAKAVTAAVDLLIRLNALTKEEQLTPLGYHLAKLPIGPQMGKMLILGAIFSCLDPVLSVAASLDFKDGFQLSLDKVKEADQKRYSLAEGWQSDHILLHNALTRFESTSDQWRFCREYFLSFSTMKLLQNMKNQFMSYLCDLNFANDLDPKNPINNMNSGNKSLVKAIICAGLYPNVAVAVQKQNRFLVRSADMTEKLNIHPKSILSQERHLSSQLLVYFLKLKSSSTYLHDVTAVHPLPVVFFGDNLGHTVNNGDYNMTVNESMKFKCTESTAVIVRELRDRLNGFLEYKVAHPGVVDWNCDTNEVNILRAIMQLITTEDTGYDFEDFDDFD